MKKYIKPYSELVTESIDRGAIVLIKGKSEGDKKKLYAAHVIGSVSIAHGGQMLFLADEFYRIREEDGKLKAAKIAYKSDATLKSALNLKSPGKISIVKNNNKTPFHWKTLKHTTIHSALREVESDLQKEEYLFESVSDDQMERDRLWNEFSDIIVSKIISTAFLGEKKIDIFSYRLENEDLPEDFEPDDSGNFDYLWEISFKILLRGPEIQKYLQEFSLGKHLTVTFILDSYFKYEWTHDPGDYWTPSYSEWDEVDSKTLINSILVDGVEHKPSGGYGIDQAYSSLNAAFDDIGGPIQVERLVDDNLKSQLVVRKED